MTKRPAIYVHWHPEDDDVEVFSPGCAEGIDVFLVTHLDDEVDVQDVIPSEGTGLDEDEEEDEE